MFCMKCGSSLTDNAKFCNVCGSPVSIQASQAPEANGNQAYATASIPLTASIPVTTATAQPANQASTTQASPQQSAGKGSKMIPAIIGVAALVAFALVAVIFFTVGGSSSDESSSQSNATVQLPTESGDDAVSAATPTFGIPKASSVLAGDIDSHDPQYVVDGDTTTSWIEGVSGTGEGSWIEFEATSLQDVHSISIMGGFCKTEALYYKNSRPKNVTITFSDGSSTTQTLQDTPFAWQTITLKDTVHTNSVRITIDSVYRGSKYEDTCISEITID